MTLFVTIAAAVTVAVTAALIRLLFFSGKTLTNASFFGRLVSRIEPARQAFVAGWRQQSWSYLFIAYPAIIVTMALVSYLLYWLMPPVERADSVGDMLRYCLLVFSVGVSSSLVISFLLIILVYYLISVFKAWFSPEPYRLKTSGDETPPASSAKAGNAAEAEK